MRQIHRQCDLVGDRTCDGRRATRDTGLDACIECRLLTQAQVESLTIVFRDEQRTGIADERRLETLQEFDVAVRVSQKFLRVPIVNAANQKSSICRILGLKDCKRLIGSIGNDLLLQIGIESELATACDCLQAIGCLLDCVVLDETKEGILTTQLRRSLWQPSRRRLIRRLQILHVGHVGRNCADGKCGQGRRSDTHTQTQLSGNARR